MADNSGDGRDERGGGLTRRRFLSSMGLGALAAGASGKDLLAAREETGQAVVEGGETTRVRWSKMVIKYRFSAP